MAHMLHTESYSKPIIILNPDSNTQEHILYQLQLVGRNSALCKALFHIPVEGTAL